MQEKKVEIKKMFVFILLIPLFLILAFYLFIASNKTKTLGTLFYTEKSDIDYQVCLKENSFFEKKCQPKGMGYIASAIDYIDISFNYNFELNQNVDFDYEYYVDGIITLTDKSDSNNILFTKTIKLLDTTKKSENSIDGFQISEKFKIDYNEYNSLVRAFKTQYSVSVDSNLKLKLYVKTLGGNEKFQDQIKSNGEMELTIPLTENTININMNYKDINKSDVFVAKSKKMIINTIYFIASIAFAGLSVITIILFGVYLNSRENNKSEYEKFVENKLKNLNRMIVSARENSKIEETDYDEIVDVRNFSELVDIADRITEVITWTEVIHNNDLKVSWFTVPNEKRLYRIIYKSTDKNLN